MTNRKTDFHIIRQAGDPNTATLPHGEKVTRQDKLFVQDLTIGQTTFTGFVPVLDYRNHFIYEVPDTVHYIGSPSYMCTCGSFAVIAPTDSFKDDTSQPGLAFACYFHQAAIDENTGKKLNRHSDGSYG